MADHRGDRIVIGVGRGGGIGEDVAGVEDIEAFVFHRPHVEIADRDNVEQVEIVFAPEAAFVPFHRRLERGHRVGGAGEVGGIADPDVERDCAARLRGEKMLWIVLREIVPNILPPLIAEFGLRFCFVFLTIAALSFLGVGIQPPTADWGSMVAESKTLITYGRAQPLIPAGAIALLTIAVNFVVDWFLQITSGLRDEH